MTTLTDAILHDRAQALRADLAEELLALERLHVAEPTHDAGQVAAQAVAYAVAGERAALRNLGLDLRDEGPVPDADLRLAIRDAAAASREPVAPRSAAPRRRKEE